MADFGNMLGSDEDSNEDIDHIPKTPGPPVVSDRDSDEDKSADERDEEEVKQRDKESDSESDSSSSESDSSVDNNINSKNDSEVERSDNEDNEVNEEMDDKRVATHVNEANDGLSSDDNEDHIRKNANESHDNESDDEEEDVVRRVSPKKNKRQFVDNSDSSGGESSDRNNKKAKLMSDNEDNEENNQNMERDEGVEEKSAKTQDLFGDMSSEDEEEDNERAKDDEKEVDEKDSDKSSVNENKDNERRDEESGDEEMVRNNEVMGEQPFVEEEEPPEEPIPETRIEVEIPRIVADLGKEVHFVKLPNFLSIDTHPYDPQWYEDEIDEDENLDDEGRARLKLKVENTIRWRNTVDRETNELKKESNSRVVRWSDGTFSLHLGEEIFDIHKLQLMAGDNNHLFIRQGTGLQGQTVFRTKLTFRPFSTESFTHRKLTLSLADRSQKTQKIRVLPNVGKDPEAHRTEMIKKEEDRLKASIRRESKQRKVRDRSSVRGPTASYLEPDDDDEEEGISISRIKDQFKRGSYSKHPDDSDISADESKHANEDESEDDLFEKKTDAKRRTAHIVESDDE